MTTRWKSTPPRRTGKLLGIIRGNSPQVSQIALVSDQHDHNVGVGMVPQLLQPPVDIIVGLVLADIIHEERPHGTAVVGRRDGTVAFLTGGIPDLSLDGFRIDLDGSSRELDTDRRFRI